MAILDFPSSPSIGQTYPSPAVSGQPQYTYDGEKWSGGAGVGNVYMSDFPPAAPVGSLWFETDTGILYVNYNDGSSIQWVAIPGGPSDAVRYGAQTLTETQKTQARQNIYAAPFDAMMYSGMQVNGTCEIDQAGIGNVTSSGYGAPYFVDGWCIQAGGAIQALASAELGTGVPGFTKYVRFYPTTAVAGTLAAGDLGLLYHRLEGYRVARLKWGTVNAQPVTLSFWIRAPRAGFITLSIANGSINRSYLANVAINAVDVWEYKTVTIPGCTDGTWATDHTLGWQIAFCFGGGTNYQGPANTWSTSFAVATSATTNMFATVGAQTSITGLTIHPGTEAPTAERSPFIARPYGEELRICQRYFWQWNNSAAVARVAIAYNDTGSSGHLILPLPMPLRTSFTLTASNWSANGAAITSWNINEARTNLVSLSYGGSGFTVGATQIYSGAGGAFIKLDARV